MTVDALPLLVLAETPAGYAAEGSAELSEPPAATTPE
jgi:hypothetical protein